MSEWFYGRALTGRGGKFILLPNDIRTLETLRDESDLPVNPTAEFTEFERYGNYWGYNLLYNHYDAETLKNNILTARRSPFVNIHKSDSSQYIGSRNPTLTFVGDSTPQFDFAAKPFYCLNSMEYFRPFGRNAIRNFGYCTLEGLEELIEREPQLFKTVITMGPRAFHYFPEYPNVYYSEVSNNANDVVGFTEGVLWALKEYKENGKLDGGMKWPK